MSQPKLLLADDSLTIQKVVSLTFADRGIDVVSFSDGDAAVEHLDEVKPDIVLADVHMPGISGYGFCELIRSNEATKDLPVVLLVGSFEPFDPDEAERVGANTHLTKPFTAIADVVATVERLLKESAASHPAEQPAARPPDTSDIDTLYEQSFVETMELPQQETVEFDMDVLDDEMIQTSYAEADLSDAVGESLYAANGGDDARVVEVEDIETESLIAESLPQPSEMIQQPPSVDEAKPEVASAPEPEGAAVGFHDPFESVAAEPPPAPAVPEAAASLADVSFEEDLLEIPRASSVRPAPYRAPSEPASNGSEIVSLSPELIEMIVQKVIDRLAEKGGADEARSVSGS